MRRVLVAIAAMFFATLVALKGIDALTSTSEKESQYADHKTESSRTIQPLLLEKILGKILGSD